MADQPKPGSLLTNIQATNGEELSDEGSISIANLLARYLQHKTCEDLYAKQKEVFGHLGALIDLKSQNPLNRYSVQRSSVLLHLLKRHPDFEWNALQGARCLDVGCGGLNPLGPLSALVCAGAIECVGIDQDELADPSLAARAIYNYCAALLCRNDVNVHQSELHSMIERLNGFDLEKLSRGDIGGIDHSRLSYKTEDFLFAELEQSNFDFLMSTSFLEHVADPEVIIERMSWLSAPGAFSVHVIDGCDHRVYGEPDLHPLEFLKTETNESLVGGCNRMRPLAYRKLFEKHGFEVRSVSIDRHVSVDSALVEQFSEPYRDMEWPDLEALVVVYFLRKP